MTAPDPDRYNHKVVGPFDRCIRCFTPRNDERAFCLSCGHSGHFFQTPVRQPSEHCFAHPGTIAAEYCVLCTRPVCVDCVEQEGFSLVAVRPTPQCRYCLAEIKRIEAKFFARLDKSGACAKHSNKRAHSKCISCGLPLCDSCDYYCRRGLLLRKKGPYCLACFRVARL